MQTATHSARRERLAELVEQCEGIYSEAVTEALEPGADVPRFAMMTSEGSTESTYATNPNLTIWDDLDAMARAAAAEAEEGWAPKSMHDLETGGELGWSTHIKIEMAEFPG